MIGLKVVSSASSVASSVTMESRLTAMEYKFDSMVKIIVASIQSTIKTLFDQTQTKEPHGGRTDGEQDD